MKTIGYRNSFDQTLVVMFGWIIQKTEKYAGKQIILDKLTRKSHCDVSF